MVKINTVTMEDKINEILNKYLIHPKDHLKITDELLNLFSVSGSAETDEQKRCEHEYYDTYFCNADGDSFELDDVKCIKCGKIDLEI